MTTPKLFLLGQSYIEIDAARIEINRSKAFALLAYLTITGEPHRRESIATLLWPDSPSSRGRASLSREISYLNNFFGHDWLVSDREIIGLNAQVDFWIDVKHFQHQIIEIQTHHHQNEAVCESCLSALNQAAQLYRADFLSGFTLPNCPDFDEWQFFQTQALRSNLATALNGLILHYTGQSKPEAAIPYARRQLSLDSQLESAHQTLMQLYAEVGQQAAALRQYQLCVDMLKVEFDTVPTDETQVLYEQIRIGAFNQGDAIPFSTKPSAPNIIVLPHHNLPVQTTTFVGREAERIELENLLSQDTIRLITILGLGGMGKTRLSLETAVTQVGHYQHGVYFVPLAPISTSEGVVSAIAEAIGYPFRSDERTPEQQLLDYLTEKDILLILDNFEHLLNSTVLVNTILQTAPKLRLLITSREKLRLTGERVINLGGLDVPEKDESLGGNFSACQLFIQSTQYADDVLLNDADWLAITEICRLVGGLPLAIMMAAAWTEVLTPQEIAIEIRQSLDLLATDFQDIPERQRSFRAIFEQSWHRLNQDEQDVFMKLSVFRGGFNREAAQQVSGASLHVLSKLINQAMLSFNTNRTYDIHELLRQYGADLLTTSEHHRTAHEAHCACYAAYVHQWDIALRTRQQQEALIEIEAISEDARSAIIWATENRQVEPLYQLMSGLGLFYEMRGRFQEGQAVFEHIGKQFANSTFAQEKHILINTSIWHALFCRRLGFPERADQLLLHSLTLLDHPDLAKNDLRRERAFALQEKGQLRQQTDIKACQQYYQQSLDLYEMLDDQWEMANLLYLKALIIGYRERNHNIARKMFEQCLTIRRALGDQRGIADALIGVGNEAILAGSVKDGENSLHESLAIRRNIGFHRVTIDAATLGTLCKGLTFLGQFSETLNLLENDLAFINVSGGLIDIKNSLANRGRANLHLSNYEDTKTQMQQALSISQDLDQSWNIAFDLHMLGRVALAENKYTQAQDILQECLERYRKIGNQGDQLNVFPVLSCVVLKLGDTSNAKQFLIDTLHAFSETWSPMQFVGSLPFAALFFAYRGNLITAIELYALASSYPYVANSHWYEDVVGKHIKLQSEALTPNIIAEAEAQGRTRDLKSVFREILAAIE